MAISIESYETKHEPAVEALNARLLAGGSAYTFSDSAVSGWLPPAPGERLYEEFFVAADGDSARGAYALKHQDFHIAGSVRPAGYVYATVSEGVLDPRFAKIGLQLLLHALRRQPALYCLGMGSMEQPLPKLLKGLGWTLYPVPFYFRIVKASGFLRNLTYAHRVPGGAFATRLAAASGIGAAGVAAHNLLRTRTPSSASQLAWRLVDRFGPEVDEIWDAARAYSTFAAVRDTHAQNRLYEQPREKFLRLVVTRDGRPVGWAVALDTQMSAHKQFGDARLGSIVDCLARPGHEHDVVHAVTRLLEDRGVDLIVANQAHMEWRKAMLRGGWLPGPSNYIFAASPELAEALAPFEETRDRFHLTRGDGEGPTHL